MCGRYTLRTPVEKLQQAFNLEIGETAAAAVKPRFNVAPTQQVAIVANDKPGRVLETARWGLIPFWAKDAKIGNKMINARGETIVEKPAYRDAFKKKRCLILADGFYEWKDTPMGRVPLYIRRKDGEPFAFAGLWDTWRNPDGETVRSCVIITTSPNALMQTFHDRMPVILAPDDIDRWLDPAAQKDPAELQKLIRPCADDLLEAFEVTRLVNSPKNDVPACIEPATLTPADIWGH